MPELPEVETIRRQIGAKLPAKIGSVAMSEHIGSILKKSEFSPKGKRLENISRHGKVLIFNFENELDMHSGLGMSGSWRISPTKVTEKHTHYQMKCEGKNGKRFFLAYVDPRRFGTLHLLKKRSSNEKLARLGIDISSKNFNCKYLATLIEKKANKILKPFLLDQNYFAGVGNYIASEICARAKILPTRKMKTLSTDDQKNIIKATHSILKETLKNNGTTFSGGYTDANGEKGEGVKNLVVFYQKHCGMCKKTKVIKTIMAGRGTYHCPTCQK